VLLHDLFSRTLGRISGTVLSVTLDHAQESGAFEDRLDCQKTLHSSFNSGSTLVTTSKTELNAQCCQLWNLTVQIDLVSKCCIVFGDKIPMTKMCELDADDVEICSKCCTIFCDSNVEIAVGASSDMNIC